MKTSLLKSKSLTLFKELVEKKSSFLLEKLPTSLKAFLLSTVQETLQKPLLIISGGAKKEDWFSNLSFFLQEAPLELPAWETLPSEALSPSFDVMGKRLLTLHHMKNQKTPCVIAPLPSFLQKLPPVKTLREKELLWKIKDEIPFDYIPSFLEGLHYKRVKVVSDKGEFALRGGIVDIFPPTSFSPFRVEFFSDEIASIRTFDTGSQISQKKVDSFFFTVANEKKAGEEGELTDLFSYFKETPVVVLDGLLSLEDTYTSFSSLPGFKTRFFSPFPALLEKISSTKILFCEEPLNTLFSYKTLKKEPFFQEISLEFFSQEFLLKQFFFLASSLSSFFLSEDKPLLEALRSPSCPKVDLTFVVDSQEKKKRVEEKIKEKDFSFEIGSITEGFIFTDALIGYVAESDITGTKKLRREKWRNLSSAPNANFHELIPGDFVVHFHSGVGKYLGCEKQTNHLGKETEFLVIQYAESGKLYVPLSQSYLVSKYIGASEDPPSLHVLGTKKWQQTKAKAEGQIVGYASDLLQLYAQRQVAERDPILEDSEEMSLFEESFPYEETEDQKKAIYEIKQDFQKKTPMDRLILGDVGYGKTEVSMRASFKMVVDGKRQVAVLVPTTVLAMQHFDSFCERMKEFAVSIEVLSRTNTAKKNKEILQKLEKGHVDIIIGTHRLLSKDVSFKNLGLVIIDEEQRFGVKAKEHLKKLKKGIDCLTLSATPIPRTLYMSLIEIRSMSPINTPPHDRLPVQTILAENEESLVQTALLREFAREGQAFFIHNRVESIYHRAEVIQKIVPQAKIAIVHGQMDPDAVEKTFHQFKEGKIDILFATSIVENGVDVPNANTIFIDNAHCFGLADLYQLRGRVGRWNRTAYAYFLTPKQIAEPARKRLSVFLETGGYGGGMKIAMRDLQIRGAGDLLGTEQSGEVAAVGFHLYCKLLKRAISSIEKNTPSPFIETLIDFPFPAKIPEEYIDDVGLRMEIYHRFGEASSEKEMDLILSELQDRFGIPPKEVIWLYHMSRIRLFAHTHQFTKVKFTLEAFFVTKIQGEIEKFLYPKTEDPDLLERFFKEAIHRHFSNTRNVRTPALDQK